MYIYLHIIDKVIRLCKWNTKAESSKVTKKERGRIYRKREKTEIKNTQLYTVKCHSVWSVHWDGLE